MKFNWLIIKIGLLLAALVFLLAFSYQRYDDRELTEVKMKIDYSNGNHFVTDKVVNNLLSTSHPDFPKMEMKRVNVADMEKKLQKNPFIHKAQVHLENNGKLFAEITQEVPIVRVQSKGEVFYITEQGEKMPLSPDYSAKVFLLSGYVKESDYKEISKLITAINADKLLKNLVVGVYKEKVNSFILLTVDGAFTIEMGDTHHLKEKVENFNLFYEQYLTKTQTPTYKKVSVKYNNQIVATK